MPVRPTLLHRMALVSFLRFRKNLGKLREFFGQMVYRPLAKKLLVRLWSNSTVCWQVRWSNAPDRLVLQKASNPHLFKKDY